MLKSVHALVGTDVFLQLDALAQLLRAAGSDVQRIELDGEKAELADVLDELRSFAMFSSHKLVIVRDADEFVSRFREQLEDYVKKPAPGSTLVLRLSSLPATQRIHKAIAATGQIHPCSPPKDSRALVAWIAQRASAAHKMTLAPDAAAALAELIGADLGRLDNELAKLALHAEGRVDASAIQRAVAFQREQEVYHMTEALGTGNTAEALRRWRFLVQLDSSAEYRAITWLGMWLEDVRIYLTRPHAFKNAWRYKNFPRFQQTAQRIGPAGAARLIHLLAELDYRTKNGLGEMRDNVERFLLSV